jgi:hypothetical protein
MGVIKKIGRRAKLVVARADIDKGQRAVERAERRLRRGRRLVWLSASLAVVGGVMLVILLMPQSNSSTFEVSAGGLRYTCTADGDFNHVRGQTTTAQHRLDAGNTTTSPAACGREAARRAEAQGQQDRRDGLLAIGLILGGIAGTWWSRRDLRQAKQVLAQRQALLDGALDTRRRLEAGD